jgi:hypothetical protein
MALTPHPKDELPKATPGTVTPGTTEATPREGTEPAADTVPFHGGGFAKKGGAYPGGWVQPEEPPPPEGEALKKK